MKLTLIEKISLLALGMGFEIGLAVIAVSTIAFWGGR
jgi:hypothetical protein